LLKSLKELNIFMTEQETIQYITEELEKGTRPELLKAALESEGVSPDLIDGAIASLQASSNNISQSLTRPQSGEKNDRILELEPIKENPPSFLAKVKKSVNRLFGKNN
jgi:hypothetical protein